MAATPNAPPPSRVIDLSGVRRTSLSTAAPRPLSAAPPATQATQESQPPELPPTTARTTSQASSVGSVSAGGGWDNGGSQRIAAEALKAICDLRGVKTVVLKKAAATTGSEANSAGPGEKGKKAQKSQGQPIGVVLLGAHFGDSDGTGAEDSQEDTDALEDYYFEDVDDEERIRIKPNANALKRIMSGVQGHNKRKLAIPTGDAKLQQEQLKANESLERLVRLNGAKEILRLAQTYNIGVRFTEPDLLEEARRALREDDLGVTNGAEGGLKSKAGPKGVKKLRKPCQQGQGSTSSIDQAGAGGGVVVGGGGGEGSSITAEPAAKKARTQGGAAAPKRVGPEGGGAKALLAGAFARALQRKVPKVVKVTVKQVGTQEAATPNAVQQAEGTPVVSPSPAAVAGAPAVAATIITAQAPSEGIVADDVTVVQEEDASLASGTTSTASSRGAGRKRKRGGRGGAAGGRGGPAQAVAGQAGAAASQKQPSQSQHKQQTPRVPPQQQRVPPQQQKQAGKAISALSSSTGGGGSNNDASSRGMGAAGKTTTTTSGRGAAANGGRGRGGGARRGRGSGVSLGFQRALQGIGVAKRGGRGGGLAGASNKQK